MFSISFDISAGVWTQYLSKRGPKQNSFILLRKNEREKRKREKERKRDGTVCVYFRDRERERERERERGEIIVTVFCKKINIEFWQRKFIKKSRQSDRKVALWAFFLCWNWWCKLYTGYYMVWHHSGLDFRTYSLCNFYITLVQNWESDILRWWWLQYGAV